MSEGSPANTVSELAEKLDLLKREVDTLQIAAGEKRRPWYLNISVLVSVTALIFSFGTTYLAHERNRSQDIQNLRHELRGLLQRLHAIPKENLELGKKYESDPLTAATLNSYLASEHVLLARQATDVAMRLPPDAISPVEYSGVAMALLIATTDLDRAASLFKRAQDAVKDNLYTEVGAVRGLASIYFIQGAPERGRLEYEKALRIFEKYRREDRFTVVNTHVITLMNWARSESAYGDAPARAEAHLKHAEDLISALPPYEWTKQLQSQVQQTRQQIAIGKPSDTPSSSAVIQLRK